jgi:hypothetical protein
MEAADKKTRGFRAAASSMWYDYQTMYERVNNPNEMFIASLNTPIEKRKHGCHESVSVLQVVHPRPQHDSSLKRQMLALFAGFGCCQ